MSIVHIKSNTIADFTGTVTVFDSVGATVTANATDLVRPVDWNSAHNLIQQISGNTAGVSSVSGTNIVLAGGNNVTLSANGSTISIHGPNTVAQTQYVFSNANGVSFGTAGSTVTATVATNYQSQGAYLTTAMVSNAGSNFVGLNSALTANGVSATINSSGVSLDFPAFLTTAQSPGAYLTTAMVSNASSNFVGLNSALTANGVSATINSSGISMNFPAFLTTASPVAHSHNLATTTTNGSVAVVATTNSVGATLAMPPWITTYVGQTTQTQPAGNIAGVGTTITGGASITLNSNGIQFNGQDLVGSGTAITGNALITANSQGISFNGVGLAGTSTGFTGANISGSMTNNSAGLALSLSVAAGGGGADGGNTLAVAGSTAGSNSLVLFSNSPTVTFGMAGNTITASAAGGGGGAAATVGGWEPFPPLGGNTAFSTGGLGTIYFQKLVPLENISFNNFERRMSGSTVSSAISAVAAHSITYGLYSQGTGASTTIYNLIASSSILLQASYSSNLSAGYTISQGAASYTTSSAGTVNQGNLSGFKHMYFPFTSTITAGGNYAFAMNMSSATTGATGPLRLGFMELSVINNLTVGKVYATTVLATNASFVGDYAQGVYSSSSNGLPATLAISGLTNAVSQQRMYLQLEV